MPRTRRATLGLAFAALLLAPALAQAQLAHRAERRCAVPRSARLHVLELPSLRFSPLPLVLGSLLPEGDAEEDREARAGVLAGLDPLDGATATRSSPPSLPSPSSNGDYASDPHVERPGIPHIPEPMVFDLVRRLGARQWEVEANVLFLMPIDPDDLSLEWAPEVELALADGFAIELELPMRDDHVEALKFGAQLTFGTGFDGHFIHGTQAIVEYELDREAVQATLVYLAALELDPTWRLLGMAGVRTTAGPDPFAIEVVVNANLFAEVTDFLVLGVEANYSSDLREDHRLLVMPQAHLTLGRFLRWQLGAGLSANGAQRGAAVSTRLIVEL